MKRVPPQQTNHRPKDETLGSVVSDTSFGTNEEIWDKLVSLGFIPEHPRCKHCDSHLTVTDYRRDLHPAVRCNNSACKKYTNLIEDSQLSGVREIRKFFTAAISWVTGGKVKTLLAETGMTAKTWASYRQKFQNVVDLALNKAEERGELKLGGRGKVVEADECKLFSAKNHRGHQPASKDIWVVGLIERDRDENGHRRSAFMLTDKRPASVLVSFIEKWVEKGSIVLTDEWRGYDGSLDQIYFRAKVNHTREFAHFGIVDGIEISINTNHIEREWVEVRKLMRNQSIASYNDKLKKEIFRQLFLAGEEPQRQAWIFMKIMAEVAKWALDLRFHFLLTKMETLGKTQCLDGKLDSSRFVELETWHERINGDGTIPISFALFVTNVQIWSSLGSLLISFPDLLPAHSKR